MTAAVRFAVRVTPRGGREALVGWQEGVDGQRYLKARVSVPPENGRANNALIQLIAKNLHIGSSKVRMVSGATSRIKIIEVQGLASLPAGFGEER